MEEEEKTEIPSGTKWFMLATAMFFDLLSVATLIPVIGWLIAWIVWAFAFGTFWLWFMLNGINIFGFKNPKRLFASLLATFIEAVPEIGVFPSWTVLVLWLTRVEKVVDKAIQNVPGAGTAISEITKKIK